MANPTWDDTEELSPIPSGEVLSTSGMEMEAIPQNESYIPSWDNSEEFTLSEKDKEKQKLLDAPYPTQLLRRLLSGVTMGGIDEIASGVEAAKDVALTDKTLSDLPQLYEEGKDKWRDVYKKAEEDTSGIIGEATELVGGMAVPVGMGLNILKGSKPLGKKIMQGIGAGALSGGLSAGGYSEADILRGEGEQLAEDVGKGSALGGVIGGALPAISGVASKSISKLEGSNVGKVLREIRDNLKNTSSDEISKTTVKVSDKHAKQLTDEMADNVINIMEKRKNKIDNFKYDFDIKDEFKPFIDKLKQFSQKTPFRDSANKLLNEFQEYSEGRVVEPKTILKKIIETKELVPSNRYKVEQHAQLKEVMDNLLLKLKNNELSAKNIDEVNALTSSMNNQNPKIKYEVFEVPNQSGSKEPLGYQIFKGTLDDSGNLIGLPKPYKLVPFKPGNPQNSIEKTIKETIKIPNIPSQNQTASDLIELDKAIEHSIQLTKGPYPQISPAFQQDLIKLKNNLRKKLYEKVNIKEERDALSKYLNAEDLLEAKDFKALAYGSEKSGISGADYQSNINNLEEILSELDPKLSEKMFDKIKKVRTLLKIRDAVTTPILDSKSNLGLIDRLSNNLLTGIPAKGALKVMKPSVDKATEVINPDILEKGFYKGSVKPKIPESISRVIGKSVSSKKTDFQSPIINRINDESERTDNIKFKNELDKIKSMAPEKQSLEYYKLQQNEEFRKEIEKLKNKE